MSGNKRYSHCRLLFENKNPHTVNYKCNSQISQAFISFVRLFFLWVSVVFLSAVAAGRVSLYFTVADSTLHVIVLYLRTLPLSHTLIAGLENPALSEQFHNLFSDTCYLRSPILDKLKRARLSWACTVIRTSGSPGPIISINHDLALTQVKWRQMSWFGLSTLRTLRCYLP